jgi:Glycosyl hydrolases family 39
MPFRPSGAIARRRGFRMLGLHSRVDGAAVVLGLALTVGALVLAVASRPAAEQRADTTVQVSAGTVLGEFANPAWYQNQSGPNSPLGPRDLDLVRGLDVQVARIWALPRGYYDPRNHRYDFNFAGTDGSSTYRYFDQASGYARRLMLNLGECAPEMMTLDDPHDCRRVLRDGLAAYKKHYPSIQYVELFNEPDKTWDVPDGHWKGLSVHDYYEWYRIGYSVVNEINRKLHPRIPLRIGGPAAASFDEDFLRGFLDRYARDPDPDKRLDFISYHQYKHAADPAAVGTERLTVRKWLKERDLDLGTPVFVTEYGVFPGESRGRSLREDLLTQAAAMQTLAYYYGNSGMDAEMHWVFRHPDNPRKSMFAPGIDGRVHPYFNLVRMQSMMKSQRVAVTSDNLSPSGLGVNATATADDSGVAVLATNYQWITGGASHVVSMGVDLPAGLAHRRLRLDRYLIDSTTSNDAHGPASAGLERVESRPIDAGMTIRTTLRLEPNALSLVVLTPTSS